MVPLSEIRYNSLLVYKEKYVRVIGLNASTIDVVPAGEEGGDPIEVMVGAIDLQGLRVTPEIMVKIGYLPFDWAQFVGLMEHYTDPEKKMYLRFHEEGVSLFTEGMIPEVYNYISQINFFHQLQNHYLDLFQLEMPIPVK